MKTFKTPKGTVLPLMDLKGKDYLQVCHRVQWFRENWPDGQINTERISEDQNHVTYRASIFVIAAHGLTKLSNADKTVKITSMTDYEKCETAAIGRALALCGYGTQFAQDLEEEDTLPDSPLDKKDAKPMKAKQDAPGENSQPPVVSPLKQDITKGKDTSSGYTTDTFTMEEPPQFDSDQEGYVNQDPKPKEQLIKELRAMTYEQSGELKAQMKGQVDGNCKFMKGKYMGQTFEKRLSEDKKDNLSYLAFIKDMQYKTQLIKDYILYCEQQGVK